MGAGSKLGGFRVVLNHEGTKGKLKENKGK